MRENNPRRGSDRRDRRFDNKREPRSAAPAPVEEEDETRLEGRNAVTEALRAGRTIDKVFIADGDTDKSLQRLAAMAKEAGAVIVPVDRRKLDMMSTTHAHQGIIAQAAAHEYATIDDILEEAAQRGQAPLIVICDELCDPHNLGAIMRSAECAGAHGVIIPKRRSVGLTYAVGKASAGAVEYVPVARVSNLVDTIKDLKKRGVWVYAAEAGGSSLWKTDFSGACALVVGSEGKGIGRLVREKCDFIVSLPMHGKINSLNASVAAGILMYEIAAQRENGCEV